MATNQDECVRIVQAEKLTGSVLRAYALNSDKSNPGGNTLLLPLLPLLVLELSLSLFPISCDVGRTGVVVEGPTPRDSLILARAPSTRRRIP